MLQRTAADIVGVPNTKITVEPVNILFIYSLNNLIKLEIKLISLLFHKLKDLDKKCKQVKLNKWDSVKLYKKMESNMYNCKILFLVILDLVEELWLIIFSEKHSLNVKKKQKMILKDYSIKKVKTSINNYIHNPHLNSD
jgi:hypothetical protein